MQASPEVCVALAQCVLMLHLAFVAWGVFGAVFTRGRPLWTRLHVATMLYGVVITWADWLSHGRVECPLTWLENRLLQEAGLAMHEVWFLMRLLLWIGRPSLHPDTVPTWGLAVATLVVATLNLAVHWRRCDAVRQRTSRWSGSVPALAGTRDPRARRAGDQPLVG